MSNLIVASFANETQAIAASHKLSELESFGDVTVYEKVIVKKSPGGETTVIQDETIDGMRLMSGVAIGTLVGALAGPVGLLVGMATGTITGAILESNYFDFSEDFSSKVTDKMQPGTVAIIAEIGEDSPDFVDSTLTPLGATIFRSDVDYEYSEYVDEQVDEFDDEIAAERAKFKSATAAEKSKIQKKITQLKEKRHRRINELKEKQKTTISNVKEDLQEGKMSRLKNRINKHQNRIAVLEEKLKEMEH